MRVAEEVAPPHRGAGGGQVAVEPAEVVVVVVVVMVPRHGAFPGAEGTPPAPAGREAQPPFFLVLSM